MKVFTVEEAASHLAAERKLDEFLASLSRTVDFPQRSYSSPPDSGEKTAIARLLSEVLMRHSPCYIYIHGWSAWPSSEILELFYGYRRSKHEKRLLIEAPVHFFDLNEGEEFTSILAMALFFFWDAQVFNSGRDFLITADNDELIELGIKDAPLERQLTEALRQYGFEEIVRA